jgi:hypothetical protein
MRRYGIVNYGMTPNKRMVINYRSFKNSLQVENYVKVNMSWSKKQYFAIV